MKEFKYTAADLCYFNRKTAIEWGWLPKSNPVENACALALHDCGYFEDTKEWNSYAIEECGDMQIAIVYPSEIVNDDGSPVEDWEYYEDKMNACHLPFEVMVKLREEKVFRILLLPAWGEWRITTTFEYYADICRYYGIHVTLLVGDEEIKIR